MLLLGERSATSVRSVVPELGPGVVPVVERRPRAVNAREAIPDDRIGRQFPFARTNA